MKRIPFKIVLILCIVCILPELSLAKFVAVLETISDSSAQTFISKQESQYLTDILRSEAVRNLPAEQNFTIMTRENINMMLPPGTSIEDCEGSCIVETGKKISAHYVTQARITVVGGSLAISAEIYETAGNKLLASFNGLGSTVNELMQIIKTESSSFFKKVKNTDTNWNGGTGFSDISANDSFSFQGKTKFIVEIETTPAGALPTIDGKGYQKCSSTPCKVQLEAGEHRFVATKEHYEDAEIIAEVSANNQKIVLDMQPNFGVLNLAPIIQIGKQEDLEMKVDDSLVGASKIELDAGIHTISLKHPCYDPMELKVAIEKGREITFDQNLKRGVGGLILDVEKDGEPQAVPVYADGQDIGSTPFEGEVPLCAAISVGEQPNPESVDIDLKWHEVVKAQYELKHKTTDVATELANNNSSSIPGENKKKDYWSIRAYLDLALGTLFYENTEDNEKSFIYKAGAGMGIEYFLQNNYTGKETFCGFLLGIDYSSRFYDVHISYHVSNTLQEAYYTSALYTYNIGLLRLNTSLIVGWGGQTVKVFIRPSISFGLMSSVSLEEGPASIPITDDTITQDDYYYQIVNFSLASDFGIRLFNNHEFYVGFMQNVCHKISFLEATTSTVFFGYRWTPSLKKNTLN